jgi:DNA polymerase
MPTRDDVLRELGLSPRWRLRDRARDDDIDTDPRRARIASLAYDELVADIDACRACALGATRTCSVPGVGVQGAPWMFVGAAGRLLDNMLAALGLSRERDVFIANVLKCRPPGNRAPEPAEADACRPYLDRQIELVGPTLIVALGKSAACTLLGVDAPVGSLRRRVHRYGATPLVVTYHPAYLLRTPADKAKAWEDLLFARNALREALTQAGKPAMPSGAGACAPRPQAA